MYSEMMDETHRPGFKRMARGLVHTVFRHPGVLRHYAHWVRSFKREGFQWFLEEETPWLTYAAVDWLDAVLNRQSRVFEYGSGGSTLFFARRAAEVVTVEHDPRWHRSVRSALESAGLRKCSLRLLEPQTGESSGDYASARPEYRGMSFERYAAAIDEFPPDYFDLVLVDGRCRTACVRHAVSRVRPGGYLMLDDADREEYRAARERLSIWRSRPLSGICASNRKIKSTVAWRRPPRRAGSHGS